MGTCFTKTEYINGRQQSDKEPTNRNSPDALARGKCSKHSLRGKAEYRSHNTSPLTHGSGGAQSTYNRWVSRKQKIYDPELGANVNIEVLAGRVILND